MNEDVRVKLPDMSQVIVSSSPHLHDAGRAYSVQKIMFFVILALMPSCAAGVIFFGLPALIILTTCVVSCVFFEWLWCKLARMPRSSIWDLSAIVTGLLLAMNLAATVPIWIAVLGSLVAIWVAKMLYGGIGYNPFNPAITARIFLLLACTTEMTKWGKTRFEIGQSSFLSPVFEATATPLSFISSATSHTVYANTPYWDYFMGNMPGCLGETSALALLVGGLFLILMNIIKWQVPFAYLLTIALISSIVHYTDPSASPNALFHLLTGGVVLGAFFMITDMVTTPMTTLGGIIFAVGAGVLTVTIRIWGSYPEGCSFAILLMNALTPLIDRYTMRKPFGSRRKITLGGAK